MLNTPFYALIAYKPSATDMCRGQVMERFDSEFEYFGPLTRPQLVETLSRLLEAEKVRNRFDARTNVSVFRNGVQLRDGTNYCGGYRSHAYELGLDDDEQDEVIIDGIHKEWEAEMLAIEVEANNWATQRHEARQKLETIAANERAARLQELKNQEQRALYEQLHAKFNGQ